MSSKHTDTNHPGYHLRVENFGKLAAADIRVGDFTVLAGPNNTGKSFVSKLLYSIFSALDEDLSRERMSRLVSSLTRHVRHVIYSHEERAATDRLRGMAEDLRRMAEEMTRVALSYSNGEIESLDEVVARLNQGASKMEAVVDRTTRHIEGTPNHRTRRLSLDLSDLRESLQQLTSALEAATDRRAFSLAELEYRIKRALNMNFQVSDMASLAGDPDEEIVVNVAELLKFTACGDRVDLRADSSVPAPPVCHGDVVYIESPVLKLLDALQGPRRIAPLFRLSGRERLTGVPDYFYELAEAIKRKYTGEMSFPDVHRQLVREDVINGKVAVSASGDVVFKEAGRSFPLTTTAAGVASIGLLAMLIERKVIDRGTMLFIDEPEAHLHPAWQVVVAEALFQLARGGVRVVLATHSLDILKWLEVHIKKNPEEEKHLALNRFPNPVFDEDDVVTKLADIKHDLTKPFVDLYLSGL